MQYTCLNDCEKLVTSVPEFLRLNRNIIADPNLTGCTLYQVTEKQLNLLEKYFKENGISFEVLTQGTGISTTLPTNLRLRKWLEYPSLFPGKEEKARLITRLTRVADTLGSIGVDASSPKELLEKLSKIPDTEDIVGYSLRYNY